MSRRTVTIRAASREYTVVIDGERVHVDGRELSIVPAGHGEFQVNGPPNATAWAIASGDTRWVFVEGRTYVLELPREGTRRRRTRAHHSSLTAPKPATVRRINVTEGNRVGRGDTLIILEAMKMELPVKAGADGTVRAVHCREGELVQPGTELIEIDEFSELDAAVT